MSVNYFADAKTRTWDLSISIYAGSAIGQIFRILSCRHRTSCTFPCSVRVHLKNKLTSESLRCRNLHIFHMQDIHMNDFPTCADLYFRDLCKFDLKKFSISKLNLRNNLKKA